MDCFQPLMEKFHDTYNKYPKYPVADAGYGSLNNYIYCQEHRMEKYMKFPMFKKETEDKKYRDTHTEQLIFLSMRMVILYVLTVKNSILCTLRQ